MSRKAPKEARILPGDKPDGDLTRSQEKRALILKTAGRMFVEQGYGAVSMDALAEAAPVSKPTLYNHFRDKKALFQAVMEARCGGMFDALDGALRVGGPHEALTALAALFLELILSPEALGIHRVIVSEAPHFPELGRLFFDAGPRRAQALLADYLKRQNAAGALSVPDPALSAGLFFSMLRGPGHLECLLGLRKALSPAERRALIACAVAVFLAGHSK